MKAWRLARPGGPFTLEDVAGELPGYEMPEVPFTPGTNGIGTIEAVGADVHDLAPGRRVALSPHVISHENVDQPMQILSGLTTIGAGSGPLLESFPNGTLAEYTLLPVSAVIPLDGLDAIPADRLGAIGKFAIPFGGLLRSPLEAGDTLVVNGATGYYGSAAVLLGKAMGAARVIAAGRNRDALGQVAAAAGDRVLPVVLTGDAKHDATALRDAAEGAASVAFDMVGRATDPSSTLAALRSLRRGGRLVLMGSMTVPLPLDYGELMLNDWELTGQFMYGRDAMPRLVRLIRSGQVDLEAVRVTTFPLTDVPEAIEQAASSRGLDCTVVLPT